MYLASLYLITILSFTGLEPIKTIEGIDDSKSVLVIEGKYFGKNIFLQNDICSNGVGFCTYDVRVNHNLVTDNIQSSAFEIDFGNFNLTRGDDLIIEIAHKRGCIPKILNSRVLFSEPSYDLQDITISDGNLLSWITLNEKGSLPFIIQQYKWNKWQDVGEVKGEGTEQINSYSFKLDFNSGENKFRVVQYDSKGNPRISKSITHISSMPKLTFVYNKKTKELMFSAKTRFEIHDKYGTLVKRGYNETIDLTLLAKDYYWLSYDNVTEKFTRK
jgi:hypothetical protein